MAPLFCSVTRRCEMGVGPSALAVGWCVHGHHTITKRPPWHTFVRRTSVLAALAAPLCTQASHLRIFCHHGVLSAFVGLRSLAEEDGLRKRALAAAGGGVVARSFRLPSSSFS
jgi:hypothetical protein